MRSTSYLVATFALVILLMLGVTLLGLHRIETLNRKTDLIREFAAKLDRLHQMRSLVRERIVRLWVVVDSDDPFVQDEYAQGFFLLAGRFIQIRRDILRLTSAPRELALFEELEMLTKIGAPILTRVAETALADDRDRAREMLLSDSLPIQERVMSQIERIMQVVQEGNAEAVARLEETQRIVRRSMIVMAASAVLLILLVAIYVVRRTHRQQTDLLEENTQRRRAERQLQIAHDQLAQEVAAQTAELNRFKSTLDQTLDGVFMFDAEHLRFFYVNEGALRQVGYSRAELLTMHPHDVTPNISAAQFRDLIAPLISGAEAALTVETEHRHKSGQRIAVEIFLQYFAPVAEPARFVAIVRDITERKQIENMKNELVSTVSHELRTPLTSIAGALSLIRGGVLGSLPAKAQDMIAIAHKNSQRLTHLINDLLDIEKLAAGKLHFDMQTQALTPLVEQAIEAHRPYCADRGVALTLRSEAPDIAVTVDSQRLLQVLSNLLSNAAKHSPAHETVEVTIEQRNKFVRLTVADQGPGVPMAFRDRIFQKFAQADASDSRQKGGTGLGLAITKDLVEHMGGNIGFDSREGEGSRFFFDLPLPNTPRPVARIAMPSVSVADVPNTLVAAHEPRDGKAAQALSTP